MYANLLVSIQRKRRRHKPVQLVYAWAVESVGTDCLRLYLDKNDGNGGYAEPAGTKIVDLRTHRVGINADF